MTTPQVSLCYLDPDWQIEVHRPSAANGRQYGLRIDGVTFLIKEHMFHRFLADLRDHLEGALRDSEQTLVGVEKERMTHVREARYPATGDPRPDLPSSERPSRGMFSRKPRP